jgi:hypothetical protein
MNNLLLEKTPATPLIDFNYKTGILKVEGRSIPEDPGEFYDKIFNWVDDYFKKPQKLTKIFLQLEYINSGSSKYILGLLKLVKNRYLHGNECIINWYYEEDDEALLELGEHYKNILQLPFNLVEIY